MLVLGRIISTAEQAVSKHGTSSGMTCKHVFTRHSPSQVPLHLQTKMSAARWMHTLVFQEISKFSRLDQQLRHSMWQILRLHASEKQNPKTQPCLCQKLWTSRARWVWSRVRRNFCFCFLERRVFLSGPQWEIATWFGLLSWLYVCFQVFWKSYHLGWFEVPNGILKLPWWLNTAWATFQKGTNKSEKNNRSLGDLVKQHSQTA